MAVVIKGKSRGGAGQMASYATAQGKNELAEVMEVRGTIAQDVRGAFAEMEAIAKGSKCGQYLYHAQINPEKGEQLTPEQWKKAVDTLEKSLKLEGAQRVVFRHVKDEREHYHVVFNRVDPVTLKATNMGNNYRAHELAAVQIEKDCGLKPLERRPNLEGGRGRNPDPHSPAPARAPKDWEYQQAERSGGQNPRQIKDDLTARYNASASGAEFVAALAGSGYTLGKGSKTDFILIPEEGKAINLARQIDGAKIADIREKFADIDRAKLPTEEQHRAAQGRGVSFHATAEQPKFKTGRDIMAAFEQSANGAEFYGRLTEGGVILCRVTGADARENEAARAQGIEDGAQRIPSKIEAGDLVAINQHGTVYKLNERTTGHTRVELADKLADVQGLQCPSVKEAREHQAEERAEKATQRKEQREERAAKREDAKTVQQVKNAPKELAGAAAEVGKGMAGAPAKLIPSKGAARAVDAVADLLMDTVCGLLAGMGESKKEITPAEYMNDKKARQEYNQQQAAEAAREEKRDEAFDELRNGRGLEVNMLRSFSRNDLEEIQAHGLDEGVSRLLAEQDRQRQERERERYRER